MSTISLRDYLEDLNNLLRREAYDEVMGHCHHILRHFPKNLATYNLLGRALLRSRRLPDSEEVFQRILSATPSDINAHLSLSQIYENQSKLERAIWHLERAYEIHSTDNRILADIRRLYERRDGQPPQRIIMTRAALARQYVDTQLYDQAIAELRAALQEEPQRYDLHALLAEALYAAQYPLEAGQTALDLLAQLPDCLPALTLMARIWLANKRPEDARPFLQRIEALAPYSAGELINPESEVPDDAFRLNRLDYQATAAAAAASEIPDWMQSMDAVPGSAGGSSAGPEVPDWLDDMSAVPAPAQESDQPDWYQEGVDLSLGMAPAATVDDSEGGFDWFSSLERVPTGELPALPDDAPSDDDGVELPGMDDFLAGMGDQAADDAFAAPPMPDWMSDVQSTGMTDFLESMGQPGEQPTPQFDDAGIDDDVPDWMADIGEADLPARAEPEIPAPTGFDDAFADFEQDAAPAESQMRGMTDFLGSMGEGIQDNAAPPMPNFDDDEPLQAPDMDDMFGDVGTTPVESSSAGTGMTDFFSGIAEASESAPLPDLSSGDDDDVPDWMLDMEPPSFEEPAPETDFSASGFDDAFADFGQTEDAPAEVPGMTDFLGSMQEGISEDEPVSALPDFEDDEPLQAPDMDAVFAGLEDEDFTEERVSYGMTDLLSNMEQTQQSFPDEPDEEEIPDWMADVEPLTPIEPVQAEAEQPGTGGFDDVFADFDQHELYEQSTRESEQGFQEAPIVGMTDLLSGIQGNAGLPNTSWLPNLSEEMEQELSSEPEDSPAPSVLNTSWLQAPVEGEASDESEAVDLPDWMAPASEAEPMPMAVDDDEPDWMMSEEDEDDTPDWLAGASELEATEDAEPDWLSGTAEPESVAASDTAPDWMLSEEDDTPDWLSGASELEATEDDEPDWLPGTAEPQSVAASDTAPDWMMSEEDEDDTPDWLSGASELEATEDAEPDWLSGTAEPQAVAASDTAPDWMLSEEDEDDTPDWLSGASELEATEDDEPDWLSGTAEPQAVAASDTAPDWMLSEEDEDDEPDWLSGASELEATEDAEPDWLSGTAEPQAVAASDTAPDWMLSEADEDDEPDWLSGVGEPESVAASDTAPDWMLSEEDEDDTPDWLSGVGEPESVAASDTAPDWMLSEEDEDDEPDWLSGVGEPESVAASDTAPDWMLSEEDEDAEPDWLSGVTELEAESTEDEPDWIGGSPRLAAVPDAEPDWLAEIDESGSEDASAQPDWLSGVGEAAAEDDAQPDWLTGAGDPELESTDAQPDWLSGVGEAAAEDDAQPDWLSGVGEAAAEDDAQPDWLTGAGEPELESMDAQPDWLSGVGVADSEDDAQPDWLSGVGDPELESTDAQPDWLTGAAEPELESMDAQPDWLSGVGEAAAEDDAQPDWLSGVGEAAAEDDAQPDWLSGVGEAAAEDDAQPDWLTGAGEAVAEDDAQPDWLTGAGEPELESMDAQPDWLSGVGVADSEDDAQPDWLSGVGDPELESTDAQPDWLTGAAEPELESMDAQPDWLSGVGEAAAEDDAQPDWLSGVGVADSEDDAQPDWLTGAGDPELESMDAQPDWLSGVGVADSEDDAEPDWLTGAGEPELESMDAQPDWLSGVGEAAAEDDAEPDWLAGAAAELEAAAGGDDHDWLLNDEDDDALLRVGQPTSVAEDEGSLPDWLDVGGEPIPEEQPPQPGGLPEWLGEDETVASGEPEASDSGDDWLAGLGIGQETPEDDMLSEFALDAEIDEFALPASLPEFANEPAGEAVLDQFALPDDDPFAFDLESVASDDAVVAQPSEIIDNTGEHGSTLDFSFDYDFNRPPPWLRGKGSIESQQSGFTPPWMRDGEDE